MAPRQAYRGTSRGLVLAFDVGTTFSGVSYSILDPGHVPEIKGVTRFPYQDSTAGDFKVPSIIWYDSAGVVRAIGAGAVRDGIEHQAEDGQWTKVEWFKLYLRPNTFNGDEVSQFIRKMPPLPSNKTIVDVFADFLRFLYESSKTYIEDNYSTGRSIWTSAQGNIMFVLSHPNGWEGLQQSKMRLAAIVAGLVPDTEEGRSRIHFVTEGEASLHFCINQGLMTERITTDSRFLVVDAGGGTIDVSSYQKQVGRENSFSELAASECKLRGAIFVTQYARKYIEETLRDSTFFTAVQDMVRNFDKTTKLHFRRVEDPVFVKFGTARDNDLAHNIRSGLLKLQGDVVASFFQPSVGCIVDVILQHARDHNIRAVFLVGGFAANDWLFNQIKTAVHEMNIEVSRPVNQTNKAVADGAASFYVDHFVTERVSKFGYGKESSHMYDGSKPDHVVRQGNRYTNLAGTEKVSGAFRIILPKNTLVSEKMELYSHFHKLGRDKPRLGNMTSSVERYRGNVECLEWVDQDPGNVELACTIEADTSVASAALVPLKGKDGQTYYELRYTVVLLFGLTELKAQLSWKENGVEKRGPARIIYDC